MEKIEMSEFKTVDKAGIGEMMAKAMRHKKLYLVAMGKPPNKKKLQEW